MSVVARQRKSGIEYYVCNYLDGKQVWEHVEGHDKRAATRRDAAMKKEIKAGIYVGRALTGATTVGSYAKEYFRGRTNRTAAQDERFWDFHIVKRCPWFLGLKLEDVRAAHVRRLLGELAKPYEPYQGRFGGESRTLSRKSVFILFTLVNTMFRRARRDELMIRNPCDLEAGEKPDRRPTRRRLPYQAREVIALTTSEAIPIDHRVFITLLFFTGMRIGEAAGLLWADYDTGTNLGALHVSKQYDGQPLKTGAVVGDAARVVPVHPELARALASWRAEGFELVYGRKPTATDFIVPRRDTGKMDCHRTYTAYGLFERACKAAAVTMHSVHSTRHTFISFCRRAGCDPYALERVTHNAAGGRGELRVLDNYTDIDWAPVCRAVTCFLAQPAPAPVPDNVIPLRPAAVAV